MTNYTKRYIQKSRRRRTVEKIKRLTKRAFVFLVIAVLITLALLSIPSKTVTYVRPTETPVVEVAEPAEPVHYSAQQIAAWRSAKEKTISQKLDKHFTKEEARVALAIIKQESSMNAEATNFNCYYDAKGLVHETRTKGTRSASCKNGHQKYAWSVDCGISQTNFVGVKQCPSYAYDLDWSINKMAEMHEDRGFQPWVAYTSGAYKKHLL